MQFFVNDSFNGFSIYTASESLARDAFLCLGTLSYDLEEFEITLTGYAFFETEDLSAAKVAWEAISALQAEQRDTGEEDLQCLFCPEYGDKIFFSV